MKRDWAGNPFNRFWAVVNSRGEVWPVSVAYGRSSALKFFLSHCGCKSWPLAKRRGFRLVRIRVVFVHKKLSRGNAAAGQPKRTL